MGVVWETGVPVALVVAVGALLGGRRGIDSTPLANLALWVTSRSKWSAGWRFHRCCSTSGSS